MPRRHIDDLTDGGIMRGQLNPRRTDRLDYIQSMLGQIRAMAEAERCEMLAYLVEMAYIEASDIIRGQRPLRVGDEQRNSPSGAPLQPTRKIKFQ